MPTIKDIARMAGVSHGTVSNVLNGRGNVSVDKIKRVEKAAEALGYQLNAQAKFLRKGQTNIISVILPNINSAHYCFLYDSLYALLSELGYDVVLYLTHEQPSKERQAIESIAKNRSYAVITVSALTDANDYYHHLKIKQERILFVYRQLPHSKQFISLDFEQAGQDIADAIMQQQYRKIGLFSNSASYSHASALKKGFLDQLAKNHYSIELSHIVSTSPNDTYSQAYQFFHHQSLDTIITSDIERAHHVRNACYLGTNSPCPPIYTLDNERFNYESGLIQYHMSYKMLSHAIVELIEKQTPPPPLVNKGFIFNQPADFLPQLGGCINLLTLPSPTTTAIEKILPHFKRLSGIEVNVTVLPFNEIYHVLNTLEQHQQYDVIRVDMAGLPWFAQSALKPLAELDLDSEKLLIDYPSAIIERYALVNGVSYALPLDPSIQMLFYRKDLFDDPMIKRLYYEKYKQYLQVPTTFSQFGQISQFFSQQKNCDSPTAYGSCLTLGNHEIVASEFLLRYYANGGRLINANNKLQFAQKPLRQTLLQFRQSLGYSLSLDEKWWDKSISLFEQGEIAMLIVYMNLFFYTAYSADSLPVGFAAVPGQTPLLGGGSLAVSKYSQKDQQIAALFKWLSLDEISEQLLLLGGSSAKNSIYNNPSIIDRYPWLDLALHTHHQGIRENYLHNGQPINLRYIENSIGQLIVSWINFQLDDEQVIIQLNTQLAQLGK